METMRLKDHPYWQRIKEALFEYRATIDRLQKDNADLQRDLKIANEQLDDWLRRANGGGHMLKMPKKYREFRISVWLVWQDLKKRAIQWLMGY